MKKLLCIAMIALGLTANAQKTGLNAGADVVYNLDAENFGVMGEANYLFEVSDAFKVGPALNYTYFFGKDVETPSYTVGGVTFGGGTVSTKGSGSFTAGAAGRFDVSDQLVLGLDLGYNFDAEDLFYRPLLGYKVSDNAMVQLSWNGISSSGNFGLGLMYGL